MKIREELERVVLKDLLGSAGGHEEEIDEPSVRDRHLGMWYHVLNRRATVFHKPAGFGAFVEAMRDATWK